MGDLRKQENRNDFECCFECFRCAQIQKAQMFKTDSHRWPYGLLNHRRNLKFWDDRFLKPIYKFLDFQQLQSRPELTSCPRECGIAREQSRIARLCWICPTEGRELFRKSVHLVRKRSAKTTLFSWAKRDCARATLIISPLRYLRD